LAISPDGRYVAYVVKAPDIQKNTNEYQVYLRKLDLGAPPQNGRLFVRSLSPILGLKWLNGSKELAFLERAKPTNRITLSDIETGEQQVVAFSSGTIQSFAVSSRGDRFVFSATGADSSPPEKDEYLQRGYPVSFGDGIDPPATTDPTAGPRSLLYVAAKQEEGQFLTRRLSIKNDSLPHEDMPLTDVRALSMSPDGRFLTFNYRVSETPSAWSANPLSGLLESMRRQPDALGLYDFENGEFRIVFDSPEAGFGVPTAWANDSQAFTVVALSPVGSSWEKEDRAAGFVKARDYELYTHEFAVNLRSNLVSVVLTAPPVWYQNQTLFWDQADRAMLVRKNSQTFSWFEREKDEWKEVGSSSTSIGEVNMHPSVYLTRPNATSDGVRVVGVLEGPATSPELFVQDLATSETKILTNLNPELKNLYRGTIEKLAWQDDFGSRWTGILVLPVGYDPRNKYPLVVMTKGWGDFFVCDTHFQTAFPPQPLAAAGFAVLMENQYDQPRLPPGHPGQMGEAFSFMNMVESGVRALTGRASIDERNIGIIGFSRTSWLTDFMLTHSSFPFQAASSADSGIYNYSAYWNLNSAEQMAGYEQQLGGPPYGTTLQNSIEFAPAFNAGMVQAPLLMEYTGESKKIRAGLEFFVALRRQRKPAELFYYPQGEHVLDTPRERVASLQRNVDWFCFWMQGRESTPPEYDPQQYDRWRKLRLDTDSAAAPILK
jgi:dipeptidyl aminopeptidase/acylaminoacyl peptidase